MSVRVQSWVDVATAVFFSTWLMLTLLWQSERTMPRRLRRFDVAGAVPTWTFFAPTPGTSDTHLVYRQGEPDGTVGEWVEIPVVAARRWFHALWNPRRRIGKIVSDCLNSFAEDMNAARRAGASDDEAAQGLQVSMAYLTLLHLVDIHDGVLATAGAVRQFAVVEKGDGAAITVVLCSSFHAVRPR